MTTELTTPGQTFSLVDCDKGTVLDTFVESLTKMEKSKETYRYGLAYYIDWLKANGRTGTDRKDIIAYRDELLNGATKIIDGKEVYIPPKKPSTVSTYITAVRVFYKNLNAEHGVPNIAAGIEGAKGQKGHRNGWLSVEDIKKLLHTIDRNTLRGKRDFAMINLLIRTGLRGSELTGSNVSSIKNEENTLILKIKGKGHQEADDFVVLTPAAYEPIQEYLTARTIAEKEYRATLTPEELEKIEEKEAKEGKPLFISVAYKKKDFGERLTTRSLSRIVKNYYYESGILNKEDEANGIYTRDLCLHSTRHTAVTLCLKSNGGNIQEAQSFARHSDPKITLVYAHNLDRLENPAGLKIDAYLDNE